MNENQETLYLKYIPLSQAAQWDWTDNPKLHDTLRLIQAIKRYGFQDPPKFDHNINEGNGGFSHGNGRTAALIKMQADGEELPRGLALIEGTGEWAMPVTFGNDIADQLTVQAYAVDHNNLTLSGSFDVAEVSLIWDAAGYEQLLAKLMEANAMPETIAPDEFSQLIARTHNEFSQKFGNTDSGDFSNDPAPLEKQIKLANTQAKIGAVIFTVPRSVYLEWLETMRQTVGFDKEAIISEIKHRLGMRGEE